jgi:hypothetical protein
MKPITRVSLFCLAGSVVGALLFPLVVLFAAGGHGTNAPTILLFPWSQVAARVNPIISDWLLGCLFLVQMPLYALVIALFWPGSRRRALIAVVCLIVLHSIAVACCFLPKEFYRLFW